MGGVISEEYRDQNTALHATSREYGASGGRWARVVSEIYTQRGYKSLLDYGCGKGKLGRRLPFLINEYDPAMPGKTEAAASDMVVCTDVLEHIEPERLDDVLKHLASVTLKRLFFNISTRLAEKDLPDGRNAHLLVRPAWWWRHQIERYFAVEEWFAENDAILGQARPLGLVPEIRTIAALDESVRIENMRVNSARVKARVKAQESHDRTATLVCYGPSLHSTWEDAGYTVGDMFTVSAALPFMMSRWAHPTAHIDCDPRPHKAAQIGGDFAGVEFWLASCVSPAYLDKIEGCPTKLWHLHNGPETEAAFMADPIFGPGEELIVGGGSVGLRAISLLYHQGYRHFEIHGMDCSLADGERYAGPHMGKPQETVRVKCGERWFDSTLSLIDYARQFQDDMRLWPGATFRLHGDGLLQHMMKLAQEPTQ